MQKKKPTTKRKPTRKPDAPVNDYQLDGIDTFILQLKLLYPGITQETISKQLHNRASEFGDIGRAINRKSVGARIRKPAFRRALAAQQKPLFDKIQELQNRAVEQYRVLLQSAKSESVRARIAMNLLYREPKILREQGEAGAGDTGVPGVIFNFKNASDDKDV